MLRKSLLKLSYYSRALPKLYYSSTSSASHDDDNSIYIVLNPFIDFDERIKTNDLKESIAKRKLDINLNNVNQLWNEYKNIQKDKAKLENSKNEIQQKIKSITDFKEQEKEIAGLKIAGKLVRQDLKNISNTLSEIEQLLLEKIIKLPNDLNEELFPDETKTFFAPSGKRIDHLELGKKLDLFDFVSKSCYFLKREAAQFELDISSTFFNAFRSNKFIPFSNPDFSRSLIVEGACVKEKSLLKLTKDKRNDDLFLHGSASLFPFCSFHTKQTSERVPIKYVAQGRHYEPCGFDDGLYSVWQSNAVQIFVASSEAEICEEFDKVTGFITKIYENIGLHFRIIRVPASELELFEATRLSFQVHSPFRDKYYEVGNLSFHSDYISKRLRMYYQDKEDRSFLYIVSGTVMKVPPLLASLLEYTEKCELPKINLL